MPSNLSHVQSLFKRADLGVDPKNGGFFLKIVIVGQRPPKSIRARRWPDAWYGHNVRVFHSAPCHASNVGRSALEQYMRRSREPFAKPFTSHATSPSMILLLLICLGHIQPQTVRVQIQFIPPTLFLQDTCNRPCILYPLQIYVAPTLFNGLPNQLG